MKKRLLFAFLLGFSVVFAVKSQNVSTEIEKKGILIENFTGIHCGFCPDGHSIIHDIIAARPGKAFSTAIHAGGYAIPYPDEPDFIVEDAVTIHDWFGASGYPSGMVNRKIFDTYLVTGRGDWKKDAKSVNSEDAPVNIFISSVYNGEMRTLSIDVELYYTADVEQDVNYLSIAYTQGNILGPQSGANMGSNYSHQHMLRGYITDVWGEVIENPAKGKFVQKSYTFVVPEFINEVAVVPSGLELIAFVTESKENILNVTGSKPRYVNYEVPTGVNMLEAEFLFASEARVTRSYNFNYFDVQLENLGSDAITTAGFEVIINGNTQNVVWEGSIPPFETRPITIEVDEYPLEATNTYSIELISINGQTYAGGKQSGSFNGAVECTPKIKVEIKTDYYADENRFMIKTRDGEIVKEFGPYPVGVSDTYIEEIELEKNKEYCMEITDEWGDSMIEGMRGFLKMYNDDGQIFFLTYDVKDWGIRVPIVTSKAPMNLDQVENKSASYWYMDKNSRSIQVHPAINTGNVVVGLHAIDGKKLYETNLINPSDMISIPASGLSSGIYLIRIAHEMNTETIKIFIH